jgi:choline-glycine betaine transporter
MKHEYYKLHAFVAGGLLSIVVALHGLKMIGTDIATMLAVPLIAYFLASMLLAYKSFREAKAEKVSAVMNKDEYKAVKKEDKEAAKSEKKRAKAMKKALKGKSD